MPPNLAPVPAEPVPAIGYIRVSMAREEMISPDIQKAAITEWARRTGRHIIDWVRDLDMSGRNFRRKVMKVIERIEGGEALEAIVYRYDRWGRNALESMANIKRVELAKGHVRSATEPYDAETAIGKYNRHNALGLAEMQSDLISENWKAALANRVGRQLPGSGGRRFGYLRLGRVPDQVEPNRYRRDLADEKGERYEPDYEGGMADVLVEMYDRYINSEGFRKIAIRLNSRGIRNTRGAAWGEETVKNVLDSGFAAGLLRIHQPQCRCGNPSSCRNRDYITGAHPAIIDGDTWEAYLKARSRRRREAPRSRYPSYRLTSLIFCGACHSPHTPQSANGVQGYAYRCRLWQQGRQCPSPAFPRREVVEAHVRGVVAEWAADIDARAAVTTARKTARITADVDRARLTRALADADAALTRLAVQRAKDPDMPDVVYEAAKKELLEARAQSEAELARADTAAEMTIEDFQPLMVAVLDDWDILPAVKIRDALAQLIRHVLVYRVSRSEQRFEVTPVWEPCDCPVCGRRDTDLA